MTSIIIIVGWLATKALGNVSKERKPDSQRSLVELQFLFQLQILFNQRH
jgi:hypothetical protein